MFYMSTYLYYFSSVYVVIITDSLEIVGGVVYFGYVFSCYFRMSMHSLALTLPSFIFLRTYQTRRHTFYPPW